MKVNLEYIKKRFKGNPVVKSPYSGKVYRIESDTIREHRTFKGDFVADVISGNVFIYESGNFAEIIKQQEIVIPKENTKYSDLIRELSNLEGKVLITSEKIGNKFIYTIEEID